MTLLMCNGAPATAAQLAAAALVNYGHFTTAQIRAGAVRGLALHLQRLQEGSARLFGVVHDLAVLREQLHTALRAYGTDEANLRVTVFAERFDLRSPAREIPVDVLIALSPLSPPPARTLRLATTIHLRDQPSLKHAGVFSLLRLRRQAMMAGCDDMLLLDPAGQVLEGAFWNLGFWRGDTVVWPQGPALRGTREHLLQAGLATLGIAQSNEPVYHGELRGFDGAFACNARGQQAIVAVEGVDWPFETARLALLAQALETQGWQGI